MDKTGSDLPEEYEKGYAMFLGCRIDLSKHPLIPRPEPEFWTARAIADLERIRGMITVLDIFSGSGCIGVAVAKKLLNANVDFSDIDSNAIEQIKINLKINGIEKKRTNIFRSDIFSSIPSEKRYDAILANPPYIDPARIGEVQKSVLDHEPHAALFSGNGGLEVIDKFLRQAKSFLNPKGFIYLEFDASQRRAINCLTKSVGYALINIHKDQFGRVRFAKIVK